LPNRNDKRIDRGIECIIIGCIYTAIASASFILHRGEIPLFSSTDFAEYSASTGNFLVGITMIIIGFLMIRRRPLENWKKLGKISMAYGSGLLIIGIFVLAGLRLKSGAFFANAVLGFTFIPILIAGLAFANGRSSSPVFR
jgi:hypothetical protein